MKMLDTDTRVGAGEQNETVRFLRFLGLCRRAGQTVHGTPLVCTALATKKPPCLVLMSLGASAATQKKLTNKCLFYHVPLITVDVDTGTLAHAVGKTGDIAAVAVMDESFAKELCKIHAARKGSPAVGEEG